jgi:hypothetical protein
MIGMIDFEGFCSVTPVPRLITQDTGWSAIEYPLLFYTSSMGLLFASPPSQKFTPFIKAVGK